MPKFCTVGGRKEIRNLKPGGWDYVQQITDPIEEVQFQDKSELQNILEPFQKPEAKFKRIW